MTTIFTHPAVETYLAELDQELAVLDAGSAADLRDQVRAHIEDALAPGATDADVAATLRRLGPPHELVAADDAGSEPRRVVVYTRPSLSGWLGQRSRKWWTAFAGIVVLVAAITTAVVIETNIAPVQGQCLPCGFRYAADRNHSRMSTADNIDEDTAPVRFRQDQAILFAISNPSDYPQRILGGRPDLDTATPTYLQIGTVGLDRIHAPFSQGPHNFARDVSIPPHGLRLVVLHWIQNFCPQPGAGTTIDSYSVRVRTLGVTRTENIRLGMAFSVVGSTSPGHCQYGAWANGNH